ncbi:MAG: hypothetical protein SFV17_08415 [Candidatus Obscuribacter sp.]|nr:hypothetical protein [Candidatus Obscuribacter sp.]
MKKKDGTSFLPRQKNGRYYCLVAAKERAVHLLVAAKELTVLMPGRHKRTGAAIGSPLRQEEKY